MFGLTALEIVRIQLGFAVSFHIIFSLITIGLATHLAVIAFILARTARTYYVFRGKVKPEEGYH